MVRGQRGRGRGPGQGEWEGREWEWEWEVKPQVSQRQNTCVTADAGCQLTARAVAPSRRGPQASPCGRSSVYVHPCHPLDRLCIWCHHPRFTDKVTVTREVEELA